MDTKQLAQHLRSLLAAPPTSPPALLRGRVTNDPARPDNSWVVEFEDSAHAGGSGVATGPDAQLVRLLLDKGLSADDAASLVQTANAFAIVTNPARSSGGAAAAAPATAPAADTAPADASPTDTAPAGADSPDTSESAHDETARERASVLLSAIETLTRAGAGLEHLLLSATQQLTIANGKVLLAHKGATTPDELSPTARDRWRARAKGTTRTELGAAIGWLPGEISDLVALAATPAGVTTPIAASLASGEASWRLVRRFYREAKDLDHQDSAAIANALFGSDPDEAVSERLTVTGEFTGRPWFHREFYRALAREVTKIRDKDPDHKTKTRARQLAEADMWVNLDREGVATVGIRCSNTQGAAIADRIDHGARLARKAGDKRTLRELRSAIATALLLYGAVPDSTDDGTVDQSENGSGTARDDCTCHRTRDAQDTHAPTGAHPEDGDSGPREHETAPEQGTDCPRHAGSTLVGVRRSAQLDRILAGLPAATINVIIPLGTLLPHLPQDTGPASGRGSAFGSAAAVPTDPDHCAPVRQEDSARLRQEDSASPQQQDSARLRQEDSARAGQQEPAPSQQRDSASSQPAQVSGGVAEVLGKYPHFLTGPQVRELALVPGSTLFRILTDPATGRYVERSTTAYRFDTAMRTHITFADVICRAPGCTVPATQCELDHVQEFGTPGGDTCEANGALAHGVHHQDKTDKLWDALIHPDREITWTSLLGRIYRTKAHDYNQYTQLLRAAHAQIQESRPADREAAIDLAIYAALSYRPSGSPLEVSDDIEEPDTYPSWDLITLTHTDEVGERRYRADPKIVAGEVDRMQQTTGESETAGQDSPGQGSCQDTADQDTPGQDSADQGSPDQATGDPATDRQPRSPWEQDQTEPPPF